MPETTDAELAEQLATLRRKMVAAATDEATPEQCAAWKAFDEEMARRIHRARPGVPLHHAFATLETLRAIQRYEAGGVAPTAVPSAPADRAAEWRAAAEHLEQRAAVIADNSDDPAIFVAKARERDAASWKDAAAELRRMADEAQQPCPSLEPLIGYQCSKQAGHDGPHSDRPGRIWYLAPEGDVQQPETQATPCSQPNPCEDGELCATHEEEQAHTEGEHQYCGPTCEVEFPSEKLRNTILCRAVPGSAGMLDELLRRAAAGQFPAVEAQQPETPHPDVVAYQSRDGRQLRCLRHAPDTSLVGVDWFARTALEIDRDASTCTETVCRVDVLAPCGAWGGCTLQRGHNMGQADIPENHRPPRAEPAADPSWPRRAWDLGLLHKGGDPHHCPACLKQPEPPTNFVCPGDNTEVLANPQPTEEA